MLKNKRRVTKRSLYGMVANALGERIVSGQYAQGSILPPETNIMDEFDISRTALREAFKVLSAKGLIQSKPKTGTSVNLKKYWNMLDPDILNWSFDTSSGKELLEDLFQIRQAIEPKAAYLAAEKRTPEQLQKIEDAYFRMEEAQYGTDETFYSDLDFHQAILDASGNAFMDSFGTMIETALIRSFNVTTNRGEEYWLASLPMHKAVYLGIKEGNPERARFEMAALLNVTDEGAKSALK